MLATPPETSGRCLLASPSAPAALLSTMSKMKTTTRATEESSVELAHALAAKFLLMMSKKKMQAAVQLCVELSGRVEGQGPPRRCQGHRRPTRVTRRFTLAAWLGFPPLPLTSSTLSVNTFHATLTTPIMLHHLDVDSSVVPVPTRHHRGNTTCRHQNTSSIGLRCLER